MTDIEKLKILTGESDEQLLALLLNEATEFVLNYTNRTQLIDALKKSVRDLAVVALNRSGSEGESARSEGGISRSFENAPGHIYSVLNQHRLLRAGGRTFEKKVENALDEY